MRSVIRYVSPLLICGLIMARRQYTAVNVGKAGKACTCLSKTQRGKNSVQEKPSEKGFSFFKDVIANILPALKNLN
jgi:hypothetical protein